MGNVDPDRLYPDPQNLMNSVRIQVNKVTKLISNRLTKVKKKLSNFKCEPKP